MDTRDSLASDRTIPHVSLGTITRTYTSSLQAVQDTKSTKANAGQISKEIGSKYPIGIL